MATATHAELVDRAVRWLRTTRRCRVVYAELVTQACSTPDAIGFHRFSELVEVKVSRFDFQRDRHKVSHRAKRLMGSRRWSFTPPGVIRPEEVPEGWGLVEAHARSVCVKIMAPHCEDRNMEEEVRLLTSAAQRHALGRRFDIQRARFAPWGEVDP